MDLIPPFDDALGRFREFLAPRAIDTGVSWVFREDVWRRSAEHIMLQWPPEGTNADLARKVFDEGRLKGLVSITALALVRGGVAAAVWYPKRPGEDVQGWTRGLKLSINEPLRQAIRIPAVAWAMLKILPSYRRYPTREWFVGTRAWAAAEQ